MKQERKSVDEVHKDGDTMETAQEQQRPRRNVRRKSYDEDASQDAVEDDDDNDDDDDDELLLDTDDEFAAQKAPRRNVKRVKLSTNEAEDQKVATSKSNVRKSSRSTQFRKSLAEPSSQLECLINSIDDDDDDDDDDEKMDGAVSSIDQKDNNNNNAENCNENGGMNIASKRQLRKPPQVSVSPRKSPAKRHVQRRQILNLRERTKVSDDDAEEDDFEENDDEDSDDETVSDEDDEPMNIQRVIASRTETLSKWQDICRTMNTSEVHYGSRWYQQPSAHKKASPTEVDDGSTFEERFLVKWRDLSFLHVSWETEQDLVDQCDGQSYLRTFFRKSTHGLLYTADERCDGAYYDPAYLEIDRILEVQLPDDCKNITLSIENESTWDTSSFNMILNKNDKHFDSGTGRQLLVKWGSMPYTEATYEFERDLIMNEIDYKSNIIDYLRRTSKPTKSERQKLLKAGEKEFKRLYTIFGTKSKLSDVEREEGVEQYKQSLQQRVYKNGGQLRDYQAEGVAWMIANIVNRRGSILADEMGLGKTLQTAATVDLVANTFHWDGPVLIVAPLSTLTHWYREFVRWTDMNVIVYHGTADDRRVIRENEFAYPRDRPQTNTAINQFYLKKCGKKNGSTATDNPWMIDVVITSPEVMTADDAVELTSVQWELLVVDEAHRLKNHKSKLSIGLRGDKFTFRHRILLTGTPIQNDIQEFWSLLNFIDPTGFGSIDDFMSKYGDMKSKENIDELHDEIRYYILRRLKEDVEKSVPPKEETLIEVELTVAQKQYYRALYEKNVKFLNKNNKKPMDGPSLNNLAMQLRKCCNHLFLLNGVESEFRRTHGVGVAEGDFLVMGSGKLILLDKLLPRLKEEGHRVILFSQFKIMLDIVEDYLRVREMQFERIDGSITGNKRQQAIDRFQAGSTDKREAPFIMLLSTRAGGVGITLTAADTCIIFDSDWNPQNDLQAQARCHRIGQTKSVKVYRLLTRKTYEMQMFHMSSLKMGLDQVVLKGFESSSTGEGALTKAEVEKLLRHGAYDIFNEEKAGQAEAESNAFVQQDIDSILQRRSHTILHDNTGSQSNVAGGTFSKASFKAKTTDAINKHEDVDIEDPDFWKKMIGEGNAVADEEALDRRRARAPMNYSDNKYDDYKVVDDDDSVESAEYVESPEDDDADRLQWGGSHVNHWHRDDVERIIALLSTFGYGRLPWESFTKRAKLSKRYVLAEIQRMCWTLVLFSLVEAVDENTENAIRRDERQIEKLRDLTLMKNTDNGVLDMNIGGILATNTSTEDVGLDTEARKVAEFSKFWQDTKEWNHKLIADAVLFVSSNTARSSIGSLVNQIDSAQSILQLHDTEVQAKFNSLVWPSLKLRGWKLESNADSKILYVFKENEFNSIDAVLEVTMSFHPELAHVATSIMEKNLLFRRERETNFLREKSEDLALSHSNASYSRIKIFLLKYGPIQLLHDRLQSTRRIKLPRTVFSSGFYLQAADTLVQKAAAMAGILGCSIDKLADVVESKSAPPHPMWTSRHDAILIHAISKHGWITEDTVVRDIARDTSIVWGAPFELSKSSSDGSSTNQVFACAGRIVEVFVKHSNLFREIKNFNQQHVINAYGLRRIKDDDGSDHWFVEEPGKSKALDLPLKKDLLKRSKIILSRFTVPDRVTESAKLPPSHSYTELDQLNGSNIFLAEILRAIIKESKKSPHVCKLFAIAAEEARLHAESIVLQENGDPTNLAASLRLIADHIDFAKEHYPRRTTQSKNILRVILKEEVANPRNAEEGIFPPAKVVRQKMRSSEDSLMTSKKALLPLQTTSVDKHYRNRLATLGENAIILARERLLHHYGNTGGATSNPKYDNLELTEVETIILSISCSLGIPVWNENWESSSTTGLTWEKFGVAMTLAAEKSLEKVSEQLAQAGESLKLKQEDTSATREDIRSAESALEFANYHYKCKELVSMQALEYSSEPETLAKKSIMLLEKLRRHMAAVIVSALTTRSDNGLGSKVLTWFRKELLKWATSLDILDDNGRPFAYTAVEFLDDLDEAERTTIEVSSIFDKKSTRLVVSQAAMLTRLRLSYSASSEMHFVENVRKVNQTFDASRDFWSNQPMTWNTTCDVTLVKRLVENGFSDRLLSDFTSFPDQPPVSPFSEYKLSNESIQFRANQLARELHMIAENQITVLRQNGVAQLMTKRKDLQQPKRSAIIDLVSIDD